MIKWEEVSGTNFELFMFHVVGHYGFKNREWHGEHGSDKGRDVVAFTYEELPFKLGYERKWVFQCKKRKKMPPISELANDMVKAAQHHPDFWVLVLSFNPTSNQMDTIYNSSAMYLQSSKCRILTLTEVEEICKEHPELLDILYYGKFKEGV
ncbi:restriction endonuclease (plasmid) [Alkalihalophilus sp. As8PL]|uniref:Restriction endonuclease n=1 Tax=Alkalihalophilus sp. As8PL TaxID=3237103 RepID=A0AB39BNY8_9BACI